MIDTKGSIVTYTGRLFWPLNPKLEDINLLDICHALGNQCRFTGHTTSFYSVAEHSCRVHDNLPHEYRMAGILHDASEAYLMDLAKPVKEQDAMSLFREAEDNLMRLVGKKYGFNFPYADEVSKVDKILLNTEYRDLMSKNELRTADFNGSKPLETRIVPWSPQVAKFEMITRLEKLGVKVGRYE